MEWEFEKECINEMARSTLRRRMSAFEANQDMGQAEPYAKALRQSLMLKPYAEALY